MKIAPHNQKVITDALLKSEQDDWSLIIKSFPNYQFYLPLCFKNSKGESWNIDLIKDEIWIWKEISINYNWDHQ